MKTKRITFCCSLLVLTLATLASGGPKTASNREATKPDKIVEPKTRTGQTTELRVIGYIEKRDRTITIKSGPKGRVYSVRTRDGKVLCENLSEEQLRAQAPELRDFIKSAVAGLGNDARVEAASPTRGDLQHSLNR